MSCCSRRYQRSGRILLSPHATFRVPNLLVFNGTYTCLPGRVMSISARVSHGAPLHWPLRSSKTDNESNLLEWIEFNVIFLPHYFQKKFPDKRSDIFRSNILSFGWFSGVWILYADVSELSVPSIPAYTTYKDETVRSCKTDNESNLLEWIEFNIIFLPQVFSENSSW
jgi:hypothetical protein